MPTPATLDASTLVAFERDGYCTLEGLLDATQVATLIAWSESLPADTSAVARRGAAFARRNLLDDPVIRSLASDAAVRAVVAPILGDDAFAVRAILFDKTPDANWTVPWHQDRSIAVRERRDVAGFGPWSEKAGVTHVQPPVSVLKSMVTVRIHLDACGPDNGPLRVIAGSHDTLLDAVAVERSIQAQSVTECTVGAGGVVVMRPLILHASSPARSVRHRRVVHLEFAAAPLPGGLEWRFDA